jgi:hypothetical protein
LTYSLSANRRFFARNASMPDGLSPSLDPAPLKYC